MMLDHKAIVVVGAGWAGKTIAAAILRKNPDDLVGFIDDRLHSEHIVVSTGNGGYPVRVLGTSDKLVEIARHHKAKVVVIAITHNRSNHLFQQTIKCHEKGITVIEMPDLYAHLTGKIPVQHIKDHWIIPQLTSPKHDLYSLFYDVINYLFSLIGFFMIIVPFYPLISLAIKLDSHGPVLYKQKRVGKKGQVFTLFKFRTMEKNADRNGTSWTTKNDKRITWFGRWLRKFRLDELPQLINVMRGEMALIGPRPEAIKLVEEFRKQIPFYEYRYLVLPGITGWAQVNYENTCSVDGALEKLQYDLYWIRHRSFWLDLKIIFKSIKVMLTGFGAV